MLYLLVKLLRGTEALGHGGTNDREHRYTVTLRARLTVWEALSVPLPQVTPTPLGTGLD